MPPCITIGERMRLQVHGQVKRGCPEVISIAVRAPAPS